MIRRFKDFIKESIDYSELIQDIEDILLELKDDGFNINIEENIEENIHIITIHIDNNIHSVVTDDDGEVYDSVKPGSKFISKDNIDIIEHCFDYLKDYMKPVGKNILDDLDVYFKTSKSLNYSYPRFVFSVKNGMNVKSLKFSFIKNDN
jgi:hypothetical protein